MDLVKLEKRLPLRAYIPEDLNTILLMDFAPWLSSLMSLTDETSAERLEIALPAVKELCIGMGFDEIKKMFEMYVDGKLNLKPMPNYFDRILLGKIVAQYKSITKTPKIIKQVQMTPEQEKQIVTDAIKDEFENYKFSGELNENRNYLYDELKIEVAERFKKVAWKHSVKEIRKEQKELSKRSQADNETLKAKCIIRYKAKLVALIFDKFTSYNQLKAKL